MTINRQIFGQWFNFSMLIFLTAVDARQSPQSAKFTSATAK